MIIHDLYVVRIAIDPFKTNPPLVIDTDAVLPRPVAAKLLQPVGGRNAKIVKGDSIAQHAQLAIANLLYVLRQPGRSQAGKDAGGFRALEGFEHGI